MSDKRNRNRTVFRIDRPDRFTIVANETLRTPNISWKAKGLLAAMLSYPHDWDFNVAHLLTITTDGRDSTYAGIKELIDAGYIERRDIREGGRIVGQEMVVRELPAPGKSGGGPTTSGFAVSGKSDTTNTYPKNTKENPSSETSSDALQKSETSSAREVPAEPSSLKRFATAEELNASPKEKEPRARANNKDDALIEELAEIWNSNRGPLPRTLATTKDIRVKLQRFIRDCRESDLDPVQALTIATRTVVASGFYAKGFRGNRRARGLGNLLANGNWVKHYESGLAEVEEQAPSFDFAPGQRVRWLKHRMVPQRGYYYGVVLGEGSNDRVRIAPESGFSSDEVNIRPDFLELADDA